MKQATTEKALQGAHKVVKECLGLGNNHNLVIVTDKTGFPVAQLISEAARLSNIEATTIFVAFEVQSSFKEGQSLPGPIAGAIERADALINCLDNSSECRSFRSALIDQLHEDSKIGHMPGVTKQMLASMVNADYQEMIRKCNELALAMAKGKDAKIITGKQYGKECTLHLNLGGWRRLPVTSTGIIPWGAWGNIPSGETYISPLEGSAEGEVLVDGSLLRFPLPKGQTVRLIFEQGKLASFETENKEAKARYQKLEKLVANREDKNWRNLAELGVGVNRRIRKLTGNPLIDEKKYRTAHIAIGSSIGFGGQVRSSIHEDIIFKSPTIEIDGNVIIDSGKLTFRSEDWLENHEDEKLEDSWVKKVVFTSRTANRIDELEHAYLNRLCETGVGRSMSIRIGTDGTSKLARKIYDKLPVSRESRIGLSDLVSRVKERQETILKILKILERNELVSIYPG